MMCDVDDNQCVCAVMCFRRAIEPQSKVGLVRAFQAADQRIVHSLQAMYWLCVEEMAYSKLGSLSKFASHWNVEFSYLSETTGVDLVSSIAEWFAQDTHDAINSAISVGFTIDEASDVCQHSMLVMCFLISVKRQNKIETMSRFGGIQRMLVPSVNGEALFNSVVAMFQRWNVVLEPKCVVRAIATDGAATMTGPDIGLQKRLRDVIPGLVAVTCLAHATSLGVHDGLKGLLWCEDVEELLDDVFRWYHRSNKRLNGFDLIARVLDFDVRTFKRVKTSRWTGFLAAVLCFSKNIVPAALHWSDEASDDFRARKFLVALSREVIWVGVAVLCEVLSVWSVFTKTFERRGPSFSRIRDAVEKVTTSLNQLMTIKAEHSGHFQIIAEALESKELVDRNIDIPDIRAHLPAKRFGTFMTQLCSKLLESVASRFTSEILDLLDAYRLLEPARVPQNAATRALYGFGDLKILQSHFSKVANEAQLLCQFLAVKNLMAENRDMTAQQFCEMCLLNDPEEMKEISEWLPLLAVELVVLDNSADAERAFSSMARVKTKSRNRLLDPTLDALMRIGIDSRIRGAGNPLACGLIDWGHILSIFHSKKLRRPRKIECQCCIERTDYL